MKSLIADLKHSLVLMLLLAVLCCALYPLAVWGIARGAFASQAEGSLIVENSAVVGSKLIAQRFVSPEYFHPRPSAAGEGYDAAASGGSNLGPLSKALIETVGKRVADYRKENGLADSVPIPADAVTSSASGLDPHISPANARLQASRVARVRGVPLESVLGLLAQHTAGRTFGFFGEPRVNVLELNLDLDGRFGKGRHP
jgi:K+-transporting ATPase ATPase C chain